MSDAPARPLQWIGSSKRDLAAFPDGVRRRIGYALYQAQIGHKHRDAKPLHGFGAGVLEVVSDFDGDTFRAVYTVRLRRSVYVLHAFQKKSKRGIATPKADIETIARRLALAEAHDRIHRNEE